MHTLKHIGAGVLAVSAMLLISAGILFTMPQVANAVTINSVTGVDSDTTGPGLDGRDFSVSWVPGTQPAGYAGTKLYILPSATTVTAGNVQTTGCGGVACQDRGFFFMFEMNQFIVPQFMTTDSAGAVWNAGTQYKAWVFIDATSDEIFSSAAFTVTSDTVTDTARPFIDHVPVHAATAGVNAIINSFVFDDQTTASGFASGGVNGVFDIFYGATLTVTESTANGVLVNGNLFKFTVPSSAVPAAGGAFQYYLKAQDAAGNTNFFCANPSATTAADCKASPFVVNTVTAGVRTLAGTIFQNSGGSTSALSGAYVFAGGYASAAVTSATDGTYTLAGLPNNDAFDVTAMKAQYTKSKRFETVGTSNVAGINMNLNQGEMMFSGPVQGGSGPSSGGAPHVVFSGPSENVFGVIITEKVRVGFDQTLNATTVNDANAADAGSPVYLTTDDGTTKVAGSTLYCANASAAGCSSLYTGDQNTILFTPTSSLTPSTFYTFVITEAVTSQTGQSVEGNRPGGGHRFSFTTGGTAFSGSQVTSNFGSTGAYMPPYVQSTTPAPGMSISSNTKLLLEFNKRMNTGTITTSNVQLVKLPSTVITTTLSTDSTEQKFVTVTPSASLAAGEYELRVKGAVADTSGVSMMPPDQAATNAFVVHFTVSGSNDTTAPTIFPMVTSGTVGVTVNSKFQFGLSEQAMIDTLTTSNVTLARGSTSVSASVKYDPAGNMVSVIPDSALAPNTVYTVTFGTGITDLAGVALASTQAFTYTTGVADTTAPKVTDARCDDNTCAISFSERMNQHTQVDANYATSVLKPANITVDVTSDGAAAKMLSELSNVTLSYNSENNQLTIKGLAGSVIALTSGSSFTFTVNSGVTDLSGNAIGATNNAWSGKAESSAATFGSFGGGGMFGPPTAIAQGGTSAFKPEGFGNFSASQFAFGQADEAFPFNQTAGQDVNVFHVRFNPGVVLQNSDSVVLTFPTGTTITNAVKDDYSPFKNDANEMGSGTVTLGTLAVDTTALTVTIPLAITGTPGANDSYTFDLKKITNPSIPKGPETGGYTVGIKVMRAGSAVVNKTSMPYFIRQGGSRSITVNIYAGSQASPISGATGNVFVFGGGPSGPMDKQVTLTNGIISAVDGTSAVSLVYSNLNDGCYGFGTEPQVTLGSNDYFGQMSQEPVCVDSTNTSRTKNIVLTSAAGSASVDLTVKLAGIASFNGTDVDIFAGGPGRFVNKTLTGLGVPDVAGYTLRLPSNGNWHVGVGPAMPKGASGKMMTQLPGNPPPPVDLEVSGVGTDTPSITIGRFSPAGVSLNSSTRTLTITFTSADKVVSGTVTDGTNGLQSVNVFMHAQGFGSPAFTSTDATGAFTLNVSDYGPYEIGAFKDGLPPTFQNIDIQPDGSDAGTDPDIYYKGKQITGLNPLVLKIKKADYSISGKVLDASNNPIGYAPVFGSDADGNFVPGGTDSNGNYTLFVAAGTWTLRSELPPDKTDACGTFTKTVVVTTESKSSQNITPTTGTCVTLSGTVSIGGSAQANVPVFIDEWDATNSRPVAAGGFRGTSTNSSGAYSAKVAGNKTYRIGTFSPDTGEISTTQAVLAADITANLTVASTGTITFNFNGGTSSMNALWR
ncbi:MAG: Ig-like domain-containing protein [Candidatus Wildermuthbacteria bacterium]|nr:Ig-like domain-containing protein [Candidatus Wildermuthbacteria bacterium]